MSQDRRQISAIDWRRFLAYTWSGVGASLALALLSGDGLFAASRFRKSPFTLGVASGDPTSDSIVLWTRLAPDPADPKGMAPGPVRVGWRVATDERGYFKATITPELMELDLRFMTSVEDPDGTGYTERSFVVENGVPGARPA